MAFKLVRNNKTMKNSKVLISGSAGYLGTVLVPKLVESGYQVTCLDRFSRGIDNFVNIVGKDVKIIKKDIREIDSSIIKNIDCVIDLSARRKSNNDSENNDTFDINLHGRTRLAKLSKEANVRKYIRISGTSVYGQQEGVVDENSDVFPSTDYSKANLNAEIEVLKFGDNNFNVTCLRLSSVFGYSPQMRWDQAVNGMVMNLYQTNKICVNGKNNRRPFLHILDFVNICKIILKTSEKKIAGELFNVGSDDLNYNMASLAKKITNSINKNIKIELNDKQDTESHTVSFKKIKKVLGFDTQYKIELGALEVYNKLESGILKIPVK
jgi:nucleoside-diphosphate-sugar epimerase